MQTRDCQQKNKPCVGKPDFNLKHMEAARKERNGIAGKNPKQSFASRAEHEGKTSFPRRARLCSSRRVGQKGNMQIPTPWLLRFQSGGRTENGRASEARVRNCAAFFFSSLPVFLPQ